MFELELPPLRRRKEDIPVIAQLFIKGNQDMAGSRVTGVSPAALSILLKYEWPGNVRELQNVMQRALVVANGNEVEPEDLPERMRMRESAAPVKAIVPEIEEDGGTLEDASRRLLLAALEKHEGNASAAMRELKIGRTRFYRMLKKFGFEDKMDEIRQSGNK